MADDTHVVNIGLVKVNAVGTVINVGDSIASRTDFSTEHRVLPNSLVPNSANHPTIEAYMGLEAADLYETRHVDQFYIVTVQTDVSKIDSRVSDGLTGAEDSIAYRVEEIERHIHNRERWYGMGGGGLADEDNTTPWSIASGAPAGTFSALTQLAAPNTFPEVRYDLHRLLISGVATINNTYLIRFSCGPTSGTATVVTTIPYRVTAPTKMTPIEIIFPRQPSSCALWTSVASSTAGSTIDFIIGLHTYEG